MEAALAKKREANEAEKAEALAKMDSKKKDEKNPPKTALKELEEEPEWVDTGPKINQRVLDIDEDVVYGAPDDHAWTDKGAAMKDAEDHDDDDDKGLLYGADGKKLSNKERKKILKAKEAADREAEYEKVAPVKSKEGAQFA